MVEFDFFFFRNRHNINLNGKIKYIFPGTQAFGEKTIVKERKRRRERKMRQNCRFSHKMKKCIGRIL